jgi:hypothetical protein
MVVQCRCCSALGFLHCVEVGSVADLSELYTASVLRAEVCKAGTFPCIYRFWLRKKNCGHSSKCLGTRVAVGFRITSWPCKGLSPIFSLTTVRTDNLSLFKDPSPTYDIPFHTVLPSHLRRNLPSSNGDLPANFHTARFTKR